MDIRSFIAYSSLATIGAALASSATAASLESIASSVQLPSASKHVRHGMYHLKTVRNRFLPNWITVFEPHQFLKNGFNETKEDLELMQFNLGEKAFTLGFDDTKVIITTRETTQEISLKDGQQTIETASDAYHIRVISNTTDLMIEETSELLLFVLKGDIKANLKNLSKSDFVHFKNERLTLKGQDENLCVLITKRHRDKISI
jgi:hypothetical protein